MSALEKLTTTVPGYQNEPVPHSFYRAKKESRHAAILLPGRGYTCQKPLLYYPTKAMLAQGADVLCVEYNQRPQFSSEQQKTVIDCLQADTNAAYTALLQEHTYDSLTIIGKSLGTIAMATLLTQQQLPAQTRLIWLTPLLRNPRLVAAIKQTTYPSLLIAGTADPYFEAEALSEILRTPNKEQFIIDGANHSMEIPDQVIPSLQTMERIMQTIQDFAK